MSLQILIEVETFHKNFQKLSSIHMGAVPKDACITGAAEEVAACPPPTRGQDVQDLREGMWMFFLYSVDNKYP